VKAVIMAGGEGTRLRPAHVEPPEAAAAIADRPMMEHVIHLLRRTASTTSSSPWPSWPTPSATTSATVGVRRATDLRRRDRPLGTAGSVRNAAELLDERFLVISGDVITDIDLSHIVASTTSARRWPRSADAGREPLEFGIVITRDDGSIERFLEKPTWGQVFSDTINTGIYVLEPEIFDYIDPAGRSTSPRRLPACSCRRQAAVRRRRRRLLGGRGHARRLPPRAQGRARPDGHLDIPGFQVADGVVGGRGRRDRPDVEIVGPAVIGPTAPSRPAPARRLHRARLALRVLANVRPRSLRRARQRLRGPVAASRARRRPGVNLRPTCAWREAS
jgi:mannose-1-phosphate guanylyltransferase/phosphomannomutase